MTHICCSINGEVHINKTKATVKLEGVYAIVKCINTNEAMNRIKSHDFLDENDCLYSELKINEAWLEICRIVQDVDIEFAPKLKKAKPKPDSKIPVKKSVPTENILHLDNESSKLDEVPSKLEELYKPVAPLTREQRAKHVIEILTSPEYKIIDILLDALDKKEI